jgi:hypothetical protein
VLSALGVVDDLAQQARAVTARRRQTVEDIQLDWLRRAGAEPVQSACRLPLVGQ